MLVEALFWFHPMVWWIGGRLVDERERACDEAVVRAGHDPAVYAESLLECCRLFLQSPLRCVAGASGSNLSSRVERIMITPSRSSLSRSGRAMLVGAGVCALASPVAAGWLTSPAESQGAPRALALASSPARALVRESRAAAFAEDETDATKAIAPVRRSAAPAAPLQRIAALRLEPIRLDTGAEDPLAPQLAPAPGRGDDGGDPGCAAGGLGGHPVAAGGLGSRPRTTLAEMQAGQGAAAQPLLDPSVSGAERLGQIAPSNEPAAVRRRPMKAHPAQSGRPALAHVREARRPSRNLNTQGEAVMICGVLDHLRPSASAAAPRSCRGGALMRPGLACVGVLLAAALSPGAVLAQYQMPSPAPMTSPPNTPVGPPGYTPYNPPANLTYGDSSPFTNAGPEGQGCLRARALSGVVASNPREVILRFGGNAFYRVRLAKDCPALVKPGANVAGVSRSTGGVICGSYDVVLKVVAGDGSVSRCGAATLSKMSAAEVKAASAPPQR
jgi:hypothetical protein